MSAWRAKVQLQLDAYELDVQLDGPPGVLALIGPNGAGKTTLLRVLAGALTPDLAEIAVGGRVLMSTDRDIDLPMEERRIGYVPQGYGLFTHLTSLDNVAFGLSTGPHRLARIKRRSRAHDLLANLGCADLAERRVTTLSGGEQQRVALARALVIEPELLLLDEPLAALDPASRQRVRRFLAERLREFGRPAVLVTHDVRDVAALDATVVVLEAGRVVQTGSLDALRSRPSSDFVAEFIGI